MRIPKLGYPTREGLYYLFMMAFVFTGAIIREINTMLIVGGFMSGPMIYSIFASRRMLRSVTMKRTLPEGVHAGTVGVVECNFTCAQSLRSVTLHEEMRTDSSAAETKRISVPLGQLARPGTLTQTYQVQPEQRGYHDFKGYQLTTSAPLGLWNHAIQRTEKPERWLIWPRLGKFIGASIPGFTEIPLRMTRRGQFQAALQGDFVGLRGWQRGDRRRDIHWRSTAKRGELLVKHYDQRNEMSWTLVLDLWLPARPTEFDLHQIELAIQIGATLVQHFQVNYHGELTVVTIGDECRVQHGVTQRHFMAQVFDQMAIAKGGPQFDAAKVSRALDQHSPHRALVISTRPGSVNSSSDQSSNSLAHFLQTSDLWPHCTITERSTRDSNWLEQFVGLSEYDSTKITDRDAQ